MFLGHQQFAEVSKYQNSALIAPQRLQVRAQRAPSRRWSEPNQTLAQLLRRCLDATLGNQARQRVARFWEGRQVGDGLAADRDREGLALRHEPKPTARMLAELTHPDRVRPPRARAEPCYGPRLVIGRMVTPSGRSYP